ncbi:uncharacterized protein [Haliotis cracherodii]|uniref:uncharacterized protein n=1 Tax=Haliotis cracherodii TaxID=6455 RepID=UPI0039E80B51
MSMTSRASVSEDHDARVFANSDIYIQGDNGILFPTWNKKVGDSNMPVVLLGDAAYPLKTWLLRPFSNRANLTPAQATFNYRLSRARMTAEHAFSRLKGRWRCLQKRLDIDVEFACTVIGCCIVLHNICESVNETFRDELNEDTDDDADDEQVGIQDGGDEPVRCAKTLRD